MTNVNFYDILGVHYDASLEEITLAKNKLAKQYHPDVNMRKGIDTTEKMQEILEAYATLSDKNKRAEYDLEIRGTTSVMQTFNLSSEEEISDSGFVIYWKASSCLYNIISESSAFYHLKNKEKILSRQARLALKQILVLKKAQIPEKYWLPDTMNWLLFQSYSNSSLTTSELLNIYDEHMKDNFSLKQKLKMQKTTTTYLHSIKKLLKY